MIILRALVNDKHSYIHCVILLLLSFHIPCIRMEFVHDLI